MKEEEDEVLDEDNEEAGELKCWEMIMKRLGKVKC